MGMNRFDASGLQVGIDATLMGQGVNPTSVGLKNIPETPAMQTAEPAVTASPVLPTVSR